MICNYILKKKKKEDVTRKSFKHHSEIPIYIYMERKFLLRYIQQFCQQHSSPESLAIHIQNSLHILTTSFPRLETSLRFNLFFYTLFSLRQRFTGFYRHRSFRPLVFLHTSGIHASTRLCVSSMWPMDGDRAAIHSV